MFGKCLHLHSPEIFCHPNFCYIVSIMPLTNRKNMKRPSHLKKRGRWDLTLYLGLTCVGRFGDQMSEFLVIQLGGFDRHMNHIC